MIAVSRGGSSSAVGMRHTADEEGTLDAVARSTKTRCAANISKSTTNACVPTATTKYLQLKGRLTHDLEDPCMPGKPRAHCSDEAAFQRVLSLPRRLAQFGPLSKA